MESIDNTHVLLGTVAAIAGYFLRTYFPRLAAPTPAVPAPVPASSPSATLEARLDALERQLAALIFQLSRPQTPAA